MFAWLEELGRVVKPGGIVLATINGDAAFPHFVGQKALQQPFEMPIQDASDLQQHFESDGHAFFKFDEARLKKIKAGDDYGVSFMQKSYIQKHWPRDQFRLLEYVAADAGGRREIGLNQDIVVMRRL